MAILITSLDASNPLHLHANDSNGTPLVSIKLTDVENYRIWASAIKLGLQTKNKMGFITGSVLKSDYVLVNFCLSDQWIDVMAVFVMDLWGPLSQDAIGHINSFKQGGLPVSEYYHKLNSLWREFDILTKLPDCVCEARAELIDHGKLMRLMQFLMGLDDVEESHIGISSSSVKTEKPQASVFVARTNDNKRNNNSNWNNGNSSGNGFKRNPNLNVSNNYNNNKNNNADVKTSLVGNNEIRTSTGTLSFTNEQVQKLMSLLNDKSGSAAHANMAGNLKLNNDVVLFDDLVIPEYCVSLLSVHKLIKDSKLRVSFDETKCVIQDLKREKVLGTGSESTGLYGILMLICDKACCSNQSDLIHLDVWGLIKWLVGKALGFPSSVLNGKSPFSLVYGREPNLSHLRSFGCLCFAAVVKGSDKFSEKAEKCVLIAKTSSRPNDDEEGPSGRDGNVHQPMSDSKSQARHGDQSFATPLDDENSSEGYGGSHLEVLIFENVNQSETEEVIPDIRRSSRPSKLPAKLNEFVLDGKVKYGLHRKLIGSKLVYRIKYMSSGEIERFKARLLAKGFGQKEGIDYEETFSPVVKMGTVRCILTIAVEMNWKIFQMDVNNAFLYGDLNEEVYMLPPPGQWNHKLTEALRDAGFVQSKNDHSLFVKNAGSVFLCVLVYVDDLVITGNDELEIENFKSFLKNKFKIKDLGELKYFLGIEVLKTKTGLCLTQRKYCLELLHDFGLLGCKPVMTPLPENIVLAHKESENDKFLVNFANYQRLVGKLIYLTLTRPDISYVVHCLSQHMHSPLKSHLDIAMRVLKYLKLAPGYGIQFSKRNSVFDINAFSDSDWAKCPVTRRSVFGYCVFVNGCLVSWKSNKQSTLSRSSTEAEYRSMALVTCEIMWIVKIMKDLNVDNLIPANLYYDNKSAIQIAANPVMHEKTKHFDLDVHLIREKVSSGLIKTVKVDLRENFVDILTKALGSYQHSYLVKKFSMKRWLSKVKSIKYDYFIHDHGWVVPYSSRIPEKNERVNQSPSDVTAFHLEYVRDCDIRFPLYSFVVELLKLYFIAFSQMHPFGYQILNAFILHGSWYTSKKHPHCGSDFTVVIGKGLSGWHSNKVWVDFSKTHLPHECVRVPAGDHEMEDAKDDVPLLDRVRRKRTCLLVQAGRNGSVVAGEELNTSSTLVMPLKVQACKKRKRVKAKKIINDDSIAEGSGVGNLYGLGDQDAQVVFPNIAHEYAYLRSRTGHSQKTSAELTKVKRHGEEMIASGLPSRVELELKTLKANEVEATRLHNEDVTSLKSRIAELKAEVKHENIDLVVAAESASLNHDRASFYKAKKEKLVETLPLLVNRLLFSPEFIQTPTSLQGSVMSLGAHLISRKICKDVPDEPESALKLDEADVTRVTDEGPCCILGGGHNYWSLSLENMKI
ncbi:ribonuclease H-like domain-containing protein [Tanacetum coccineum]